MGHRGAVSRGGARSSSSTPSPTPCAPCGPTCPALGLARRRARGRAGRRAGVARTRPRRFDLALCDPPYAFDDWDDLLGRLGADVAVLESDRAVRRPGDLEDHQVQALRRYARDRGPIHRQPCDERHPVTVALFPGLLRPVPQRPPRGGRAGRPALRRGGGGHAAQPPEGRAAVQPGGARGDAHGVGGPPRRTCGSCRCPPWSSNVAHDVGAIGDRAGACGPSRTSRTSCRWPR